MKAMNKQIGLLAVLTGLLVASSAFGADLDALRAQAKKPPKDPDAALELGRSLRRAGLYDDALRVLRSSYARGKGELGVALRYEGARTLIAANRQKDALRECATLKASSAVKFDTCAAEAHLLWRRASLALPEAEHALAENPSDYDALVAKARALAQMGKTDEAVAAFEAAIKQDASRYEAHEFLGELYDTNGKTAQALSSLKKAVAAAPDEPVPLLRLGEALPAGSEAKDVLQKALAIRPSYGAAHARLGEVELEAGAVAEAEKELRAALAIDAKQADWHAGLAKVLVAKSLPDEALKETAIALKLVSNHAPAKLAEADALAAKGEVDLAIEAYEKAASYARSSPEPMIHAARATLSGNRPTTARAFADRATQSFPDWGPAWVVLGDVALATKDKAEAKLAYKKALAAPGGNVDKAALKKKLAGIK